MMKSKFFYIKNNLQKKLFHHVETIASHHVVRIFFIERNYFSSCNKVTYENKTKIHFIKYYFLNTEKEIICCDLDIVCKFSDISLTFLTKMLKISKNLKSEKSRFFSFFQFRLSLYNIVFVSVFIIELSLNSEIFDLRT